MCIVSNYRICLYWLGWLEFIFFTVACMGLYFGFMLKTVLITH